MIGKAKDFQQTTEATGGWNRFFSPALNRNQPCGHLNLGHPGSRTAIQEKPPGLCTLLQQHCDCVSVSPFYGAWEEDQRELAVYSRNKLSPSPCGSL